MSSASTSDPLPYSPFKLSKTTNSSPSLFNITFVAEGVRYEYGFSIAAGGLIEREQLIQFAESDQRTRARVLFERTWKKKEKNYDWKFGTSFKGERTTWKNSTRDDALFLSTATQLNSSQLRPVYEWFQKKLQVIVGPVTLNNSLSLTLWDEPKGKERLLPFLQEADLGIVDLNITKEPVPSGGGAFVTAQGAMLLQTGGRRTPDLIKVRFSHLSDDPKDPVAFDFSEESSGTQILFNTAGAWLNVIKNGEVLLYDEIDTNMHPKLLLFLTQKFNSTETNSTNAQLICSTHNTTLLDRDTFRRDQFWFVEKAKNGASKLYPLTDFSPRNDEVLERWYMRGRYGAIPTLPIRPK